MRAFLDTNVLASAAATRGLCADVLREVLAFHQLLLSRDVLRELRRVLAKKLGADRETVGELIALLREEAVVARPGRPPKLTLKDADDLPILAAAVAGKADVFVTGDAELLRLSKIGQLRVVSPRQFWDVLTGRRGRGGRRRRGDGPR